MHVPHVLVCLGGGPSCARASNDRAIACEGNPVFGSPKSRWRESGKRPCDANLRAVACPMAGSPPFMRDDSQPSVTHRRACFDEFARAVCHIAVSCQIFAVTQKINQKVKLDRAGKRDVGVLRILDKFRLVRQS
jgi:hypothetical protein